MMDIFHFLLWLYLVGRSQQTTSVLKPSKTKDSKVQTEEWMCSSDIDVEGIICSCNVPHTVRCKGEAISPEILKLFTKKLAEDLPEGKIISLLDLSFHPLQSIPPGLFSQLKLMGLVINKAEVRQLHAGAFMGLEVDLAALGLPGNNLSSVPKEAIEGLVNLKWLNLGTNQIEGVKSHGFPSLQILETLNLDNNYLKFLETEAFSKLPKLKSLNLSNNKLEFAQLNERSLWGLDNLKSMNLQSNKLEGPLSPIFLSSMNTLQTLDLSHNEISKITMNALSACEMLETLDLSHNSIDVIEDHAFRHLGELKHLELSHNNIVAVSGASLAGLTNLKYLGIADNSLLAITVDLLQDLTNLKTLDVASNDITIIQSHVFNYTTSLRQLDLSDNPLHCDCTLMWLWRWIQRKQLTNSTKSSAVCTTPPSLENAILGELGASELICMKDGTDYYHDGLVDYEEPTELRMSEAEIALREAKWTHNGIQLLWHVDAKAIPYECQSLHIYEMTIYEGKNTQVPSNTIALNCSSDLSDRPNEVVVNVPEKMLDPGRFYRYCLLLIERGTSDDEGILPGCSNMILLHAKESAVVSSLTTGTSDDGLVVQIKFKSIPSLPCSYRLYRLRNKQIEQQTEHECSKSRHFFSGVTPGKYVVCIDTNHLQKDVIEQRLHMSSTDEALSIFPACTVAVVEPKAISPTIMVLLFTIPGLALCVGVYLFARKYWSGRVPWKWDPRATKRAKYFLYTGESTSPNVSMDPLPIVPPPSESTTPV